MCADYIAAGLPPDRFWNITPRLYLIEMKGAGQRMMRERGLVWDGAIMTRDGVKLPKRDQYTGKTTRQVKSWETQLGAWEAYAQAQQMNGGA